ncbi:hypothetical protein F183_A53720 [Bryobacterales bacterium F-183]|nr:hypothetical protein F183_A53720 [Bryobacterales bacterium F-183]
MRVSLVFLAILGVSGCGYVGDPLPPALNIPQRIADLKAEEVGDRIEVEFTLPSLTTEGIVLKSLGGVDLRAGANLTPFNESAWAESAKVIEMSSEKPGIVRKRLPAKEWAGKEILIGVRAMNTNGRTSGWSNFVILKVVEPLAKPVVRPVSDPQGVKLTWTGAAPTYRVFRKAATDKEAVQVAEVNEAAYLDATADFGAPYSYSVVAVNGNARSDASDTVEITPEDKFPPAVPANLQVILGINTAELAWDRVTDTDLRGYRVYRSVDGAEFEKIADLVELPSYSDKSPAAGKTNRYVIAAVDQRGNESGRSAPPVEINVPQP